MFKKVIKGMGIAFVVLGFVCLVGLAGADELDPRPIGLLLVDGVKALAVMGFGAMMIGGDAE